MLLEKPSANYKPAEEGVTQAVLCDVVDLGFQEDIYNPGEQVHKLKLMFQTEETTEDGVPFVVGTYPTKASLDSRSNLTKIIKALLGRELSQEDYTMDPETKKLKIDIYEVLKGKNAMVEIKHREKGDKVYANVVDVSQMPTKIKDRLTVSEDYVRVKDRVSKEEDDQSENDDDNYDEVKAKAGF